MWVLQISLNILLKKRVKEIHRSKNKMRIKQGNIMICQRVGVQVMRK